MSLFKSYSFLKHKKMKNYLTSLAAILVMVLSFVEVNGYSATKQDRSAGFSSFASLYADCYVYKHRFSVADLMPWISIQRTAIAACPTNQVLQAGPGQCSVVANFDFALTPLVIPPADVTASQNNVKDTINSTIYCATGQSKYRRTFAYAGMTDLNLHTIRLGVYQALNGPTVTINVYNATSSTLLSTTSAVIPNMNQANYNFALSPTLILAGSSYIVEVVASAPWVNIFKIGRNSSGNTAAGEASYQSLSCTLGQFNVEGNVNGNSIMFCAIGTPNEYKVTKLPYGGLFPDNTLNSGDAFPIGISYMRYKVMNASGNTTLDCDFTITVNNYVSPSGVIACNDQVQVSLGDSCETIVTPRMILQGDQYGCYDLFTVQITGINGADLGNKVTKANIGQKLKVQIKGPNGNSCWGEILVEDKFGPKFVCNDVYATCSTDLKPGSPLSTRVPVSAFIQNGIIPDTGLSSKTITIPVNLLAGTTITDLNVYLDISHKNVSDLAATLTGPNGNTITLFMNPGGAMCSEDNIMVTMDDQASSPYAVLTSTCETTNPSIAGTYKPANPLSVFNGLPLEGDWKVTIYDLNPSQGGNINHIDLIFSQTGGKIPFPTNNNVTFTHVQENIYIVEGIDACSSATLNYTDTVIEEDCNSIYSKVIKRCWTGKDVRDNPANACCQYIYVYRNGLSTLKFPPNYDGINGNPAPLSCLDYGMTVPPTSVTGIPTGDLCYNVQLTAPTDVRIDICKKSYKLIRTHKVIEWCSGQVIVHNQIIKVIDDKGPELTCPKNITISTDDYSCNATYSPEKPVIGKECSDILSYHLTHRLQLNPDTTFTELNVNQATGTISKLPMGDNWIKWTVTDECNNSSFCTFKVTIVDRVLPNPVCDKNTVVSISGTGVAVVNAITFDDGSFDNCGILKFEVRKMTDLCNFGTIAFTPTVRFCCEEVNTTVMVEFRVTDLSGNSNTCMVEVKVQDKLPPYITECPKDITLDCQSDYKDLAVTGEPKYVDNCGVVGVKHQDEVKINQCGVGTITRTWTVEDKQGFKNSCVQVITLIDKNPFRFDEIKWPLNYETKICYSNLSPSDLPTGFDRPTFSDDNCSLVAAHYKDQVFKFVDGACEKILRTWTVIDWCTYNDSLPVLGQGWYERVQIIKLQNDIAPSFEFACVDRTIASYGNCEDLVDFTMTAIDDCPENNTNLLWKYELDIDNNGSIDFIVNSNRINRVLKNGKHKIKWTVEDKCGNRSFCTHYIELVERKKPTPYCLTSITTAVMNSNGTISIWAKDYDLGSFDNCTKKEDLWFTFYGSSPVDSLVNKEHYFFGNGFLATEADYKAGTAQIWIPSKKSSGLLFDCDDIPNGISQEVSLEMSVIDLAHNSDYCTVNIILQDNSNFCPDNLGNTIAINGRTSTSGSIGLRGVDVKLESNAPEQNRTIITDAAGNYSFVGLPTNRNYTVSLSDNRNMMNGVSTLDLVLIQRHILGLEVLNEPSKIIAADVDNNSKVTASDLVGLRKTILGITSDFPNNQKSWRFMASNQSFTDVTNPFPFTEKLVFNQLIQNKVNQNFVGIKIGDVNKSATINANDVSTELRSKESLTFETNLVDAKAGDVISIPIYSSNFENIFGFQLTFEFNSLQVEMLDVISNELKINEANFGMHKLASGIMTTSWNNDIALSASPDEPLFTVRMRAIKDVKYSNILNVSSSVTPAVAFDGNQMSMAINMKTRSVQTSEKFALMQNKPNPFNDKTSIAFILPNGDKATIKIMDISGKVIKTITGNYPKGENVIQIDKNELGSSGIFMYQIESGKFVDTKKMIIIE